MANELPILVVVLLSESGIRLRSCIVNAHSRRSSDGSASPVMDRVLSGVFPEPIPLCGEESDEIPDRDLSMPGSHGRCLKGSVPVTLGRVRVPGAQNIPIPIDRNAGGLK